jgi:outer membrane protein, multidrug efflux system
MRRPCTLVATLVVLVMAAGCSLAPQYARPELPVAPNLPEAPKTAAAAADVPAATPWQEFVADARLRGVIDLVLRNNRDLRTAALNAQALGAQYRIQRAQLLPTIGAGAAADVRRVPGTLASNGDAYTAAQYTVSAGVSSWELDLFGRIRNSSEVALNQYLAAQQVEVATRTSLIAAAASIYVTLGADSENRKLSESPLAAQQRTLELIQRSRDAGIASDLDVRQAQTQVEAARVDVARYAGFVELDRHALEELAATAIPAEMLPESLESVAPLKGVTPGLSSDVLLRRPDILAAEYALIGANANIGVARAAYFPRVTITGLVGLSSSSLSDLFSASGGAWNFAPQLAAPIFTWGARQAATEAARLRRDAAVAQYEKSIQVAFREVSDALSRRSALLAQRDAEAALVAVLQDTYRLSEVRYKAGIDGYLGVLIAQRALFLAQQALVNLRLAEQQNLVNLYKVLGGGV